MEVLCIYSHCFFYGLIPMGLLRPTMKKKTKNINTVNLRITCVLRTYARVFTHLLRSSEEVEERSRI